MDPPQAAPAVTFRPLVDDDLGLLHGWMNEPGVVRWWEGNDVTPAGLRADYGSDRPPDLVEHWVALVDDRPIGWIQCYPPSESPDEVAGWREVGGDAVDVHVAGIDYLVGDPAVRGQGIGAAMIRAFVIGVVFLRHPSWTQAAASPYVANEASWRALAKAGFTHLGDVPAEPGDPDGPARLMVISRTALPLEPPTVGA